MLLKFIVNHISYIHILRKIVFQIFCLFVWFMVSNQICKDDIRIWACNVKACTKSSEFMMIYEAFAFSVATLEQMFQLQLTHFLTQTQFKSHHCTPEHQIKTFLPISYCNKDNFSRISHLSAQITPYVTKLFIFSR